MSEACDPTVKIRAVIERILSDEKVFKHSAKASFKQFDKDEDGFLAYADVKAFFDRLRLNLSIPMISESSLKAIFEKYDSEGNGQMGLTDFLRMYKAILLRIRDRFYPPKIETIRSALFVPMRALESRQDVKKILKFLQPLGSGMFGEVYHVRDLRIDADRACKIINKAHLSVPLEQVEEEIRILKSVDHPNVINIFEVFEDQQAIYILQEFCSGGELLNTLTIDKGEAKPLDEESTKDIMRQVFEGLAHIHGKRIIHKDLKPENILFVDEFTLKIIDFGLGEIFRSSDTMTTTLRGSAIYMAPEAFKEGRLCLKSDVWSAGCVMYNILTGRFAFDAIDEVGLRKVVLKTEADVDGALAHTSDSCRSLMRKLFVKDPEQRPTCREVLKHPWFGSNEKKEKTDLLTHSVCLRLRQFSKQSGLRNIFLNMMATQLSITNEQVQKTATMFKALDKESRGVVMPKELREALIQAGIPEWDANLIIQQLDYKGEGEISYREFLAAAHSWKESEMNLAWMAFQRLPQDSEGRVSVANLRKMLTKLGTPEKENGVERSNRLFAMANQEALEQMIRDMDRNNDAFVDWADFSAYVSGQQKSSNGQHTIESVAFLPAFTSFLATDRA